MNGKILDVRSQRSYGKWHIEHMVIGDSNHNLEISKSNRLSSLLFVLCLLGVWLFTIEPTAEAQQRGSIRRIGYLFTGFQPPREFLDAMNKLGYADGQNIVFEYRAAEGREERLPELAADLVRQNVAVIVAPAAAAGLAAKEATKTIPIVYLGGGDPVALGLVDSLARPGGNVTGITELSPQLTAKRLELLRESFPNMSNVAVLARKGAPGVADQLQELQRQAAAFQLKLQIIEVGGANEIESLLSAAIKQGAGALMESPNPLFHANRKQIVEFAARSRVPSIFHLSMPAA